MCSRETAVFPQLKSANIPIVIRRILYLVNYTEDVTVFRGVSQGWRAFIDREMLRSPQMRRKQFVDAWTKQTSTRKPLGEIPWSSTVTASGEYVFVEEFNHSLNPTYKTHVYKDFEFVGYFVHPRLEPFFYSKFHSCGHDGNFFVRLQCTYTSLVEYSLCAYVIQDQELRPCDLRPRVWLGARRKVLDLRRVDDKHLYLVCAHRVASAIVIINLVDGKERSIPVSRVGQHRPDACLQRGPDAIAMDEHGLAIYWDCDNFLQLLDYVKGEEVWTSSNVLLLREPHDMQIVKTGVYTCLSQSDLLAFQFHDNRTGQFIRLIDITWRTIPLTTFAIAGPLMICSYSRAEHSTAFDVFNLTENGQTTRVEVSELRPASCRGPNCGLDSTELLAVVRKRLLLISWNCVCARSSLVILDLAERCSPRWPTTTLVTLADVAGGGNRHGQPFEVDVLTGRLVCANASSNMYDLLVFGN